MISNRCARKSLVTNCNSIISKNYLRFLVDSNESSYKKKRRFKIFINHKKKKMKIGYARVSKLDQNLDRQLDQLKREGCERIYQEKITGTRKDRTELIRMMDAVREGDTIIVCELTRLSRSVKDLFELVEKINSSKANIRSLKEPWLDTTTAQGRLLFSIFSGVS